MRFLSSCRDIPFCLKTVTPAFSPGLYTALPKAGRPVVSGKNAFVIADSYFDTFMKFVAIALPVLLVAAGLAGCNQTSEKPAATQDVVHTASTPNTENTFSKKLDLYTQAYYLLMNGPDSLQPAYNTFHLVRKAKSADDIRFSTSRSLNRGLELFGQGLAIEDENMGDLDEAVRDAWQAGNQLRQDEQELEPYFRNREYRKDHLAKARASYNAIQNDYEIMFSHMAKIETLLFQYRKEESVRRMDHFREKGDWLGYYTEESIQNAQDLLALFVESEEPLDSATLYARGNQLLHRLETSLAAQRKAYEEARASGGKNTATSLSVYRILTSLVGSYRDLRQRKKTGDLAAMHKKFNDALMANRRGVRPTN